ncbi:XRE family transcriptional regulator [Dactylosporangium roseum]|uniref:XRE family transcriptional regulator n=1 Tax=Dactylosporangium roseum TaxID=47989 RepID=A0ABY5ZHR4_9ACTN|nr:XRE family transcriptional regulator [Dactylosporangium roseum]UWZ39794.1 XRE family transcriptional regulator [Dactylosporangium roseum]
MPETHTSPPSPDGLTTSAEFVAALASLRRWSGLTYRQLAAKAEASGTVLPSSTIASALSRATLPKAQVVEAFVRACGLDDEAAARWSAVRQALAVTTAPDAPTPQPVEHPRTSSTPTEASRGRGPWVIAAAGGLLIAIILGTLLITDRDSDNAGSDTPVRADGWYVMKPVHITDQDLCLGEGRERNGHTDRPIVVQRPCDAVSPDTYLKAVGSGVYEIQWHNPVQGTACLTVDDAIISGGALLAPADCAGAAHQRFLLEAMSAPAHGGFRLRPVHSGLCIGILGGPAEMNSGAEAVQMPCTGAADQEFLIELTTRVNRPS